MQLPPEAYQELQDIYLSECGEEVSMEEVQQDAQCYLELFSVILKKNNHANATKSNRIL